MKKLTTKARIEALANLTVDCYSRDRYGESGWRGAIRVLIEKELNDAEIIAFLDSKHMRWAGDGDNKRSYGRFNGETLRAYIKKDPGVIGPAQLRLLL